MAGLRIPFQFFGKGISPIFWSHQSPFFSLFFNLHHFYFICFSFTSFVKRSHQGSPGFPWVPLGSLGFLQLNIIDFKNRRPKMADFSLKTFRLFIFYLAGAGRSTTASRIFDSVSILFASSCQQQKLLQYYVLHQHTDTDTHPLLLQVYKLEKESPGFILLGSTLLSTSICNTLIK